MEGLELGRFNLVVVGAGMIGSAAAYHATCILPSESSICLLGPEEPKLRDSDPGRSIFGAYYDKSRIFRRTDSDVVWAVLAQRSYFSLHDLQQNSGIGFINDKVGCLTVCSKEDVNFLLDMKASYEGQRFPIISSSWENLKNKPSLKYFNFLPGSQCVYEFQRAGYINPRLLVRAHQQEAQKRGCTLVRQVVARVEENPEDDRYRWKLTTDSGQILHAMKVLVATGAFTSFRNLLPRGIQPHIGLKAKTLLFAEIPEEDLRLYKDMPCILNRDTQWHLSGIIPPIRYPDGKHYVKISNSQCDQDIATEDQTRAWYQGETPRHIKEQLQKILLGIIPGLRPASMHTVPCVITRTPSRRPFIDLLRPSLGVALGGNGYAAKSCDEIGRLAVSLLVTGKWSDKELMQNDFRFVSPVKL